MTQEWPDTAAGWNSGFSTDVPPAIQAYLDELDEFQVVG